MRPFNRIPLGKSPALLLLISVILCTRCGQVKTSQPVTKLPDPVLGFGILERLPGLWSGSVTSTTPAGSFDRWYVDFRPLSWGEVSQYSTLDADTVNAMSFFIVKHDGILKVAMRTEGAFQNKGCVTYEVMDKVDEDAGYYRFSDFQPGEKRAYTEFRFSGDSFVMDVYTSKFNQVNPPVLHSHWEAKLGSKDAAAETMKQLGFPQAMMVKDFSGVFKDMPESIYFTFENDPYSSLSQPLVGQVTVNISIDKNLKTGKKNKILLLLTTECLFDGIKYIVDNLKYTSRYVYLDADALSYTFKNVHPGDYYLYSYIDIDGDKKYLSGDLMCSDVRNTFTLEPVGKITVNTLIDYKIP
ncbi:MAG: hypothetical protein HPY53_11685 [Brevinematales bacterium]|nr:hypothetical protein [Brevinematales bacterium]